MNLLPRNFDIDKYAANGKDKRLDKITASAVTENDKKTISVTSELPDSKMDIDSKKIFSIDEFYFFTKNIFNIYVGIIRVNIYIKDDIMFL